jgi:hypothetical protein
MSFEQILISFGHLQFLQNITECLAIIDDLVGINCTQFQNRWVPPPVSDTVTKILLGYPYSLELYRSLKSKTELLDAAIAVGDGNATLAVSLCMDY